MSKGPENTFIGSIHRRLPSTLYRIKNHNSYNSGQPDCWYSGSGSDLWIEYKFLIVPKRDNTVINMVQGKDPMISRLQQQWLEGRFQEGRRVGVMLGCKEGGVWFPNLDWQYGFTALEFRSWLTPPAKLAALIERVTKGHNTPLTS